MSFTLIALMCLSLGANAILIQRIRKKKNVGNDSNYEIQKKLNEYKLSCLGLKKQLDEADMLARLVKQSPNAIMIMDVDGNIQMTNQGFSSMYEYSFNEFINALGSNYRQTSFGSDVDYRLAYVTENKSSFRYEALNVTRTGKELWTQTALVPILDNDGNVTHLVTIDTDINQRIIKSDQLVAEMEDLNMRIDNLANQFKYLETEFVDLFRSINELYKLVEQTNEILSFIKGISDETRILGFNASIEANRAGSHGTGFRVITNEIIDISAKTILSIGQIKSIVDSIKNKQNELMIKRDDSESRMDAYHQLVSVLKNEVSKIEMSIIEFKSLA